MVWFQLCKTRSMMSHFLCCMLFLVLLSGRTGVLASNSALSCGYDVNCQAKAQLISTVNKMNDKLDEMASNPSDANEKLDKLATDVKKIRSKQVTDIELLMVKGDRSLSSSEDISTHLGKHSADLVRHDDRLKTHESLLTNTNEKLDKVATDVHKIHSKQATDKELLMAKLDRNLASTAAISTRLERHSADLLRLDDRLKAHESLLTKTSEKLDNMYKLVQSVYSAELGPQDCADIRRMGSSISGVYQVYIQRVATDVYCDFRSATDSWLVFQRRRDGSQNFDRTWGEYEVGFGSLVGEFWLGNAKLSSLTKNKKYKLRIELEDFWGEKRWAEYSTFSVRPAADKYRLTIGGYSGNAGNSLLSHNNMMFSTKDADNDICTCHCGHFFRGGWWFETCLRSHLNGLYLRATHKEDPYKGIHWYHWKGLSHSLKTTEMKISSVK